jgi:hypothetical protein
MTTREQRIDALRPGQALDIVQYMTSWLDARQSHAQELAAEQEPDALNALFEQAGYSPLPLSGARRLDDQAAGEAARQVLHLLAGSDDSAVLGELDHWLAGPPAAGTMVLAELVVLPIVLTACIVVLQTGFEFTYKDGKAATKIGKKGLAGKDLSNVLATIYRLLKPVVLPLQ